ncbi:MAG TPA: FAD-binding oxidoreductase [Vicinamibacterales bacterium]|nr:FAD-binding oxidoreductase [Vicinamibacterales bacterium]
MSTAERAIAGLKEIVGDVGLVLGSDLAMRSCDPFRTVPPRGGVLVRPANTAQVSAVLRWCHAHGQRIVTHGGRTGVAAAAYADEDEVVLSLERLRRIEEIDPVGQLVVTEAGITLEGLQQAVEAQGLFYPIDLGAKGSATIGGTIATNAGGNRVVRWGMTRANVLGLEAVLADGTVVCAMNRLVKNNTGYDVKHDFIGSEGTLGVITRAVLKLVPAPNTQQVMLASLPSFAAVLQLLGAARRLHTLSAFEVMWQDYYALVARSGGYACPLTPEQPFYVLLETMGYQQGVDERLFGTFVEEAFNAGWIADAAEATSERQIAELWRVREGSEALMREMNPFVAFDVSVDIRRAEEFVNDVRRHLARRYPDFKSVSFGHLGDNNLHLGVHIGTRTLDEEHAIERCVYEVVRQYGGALTAEHGIGRLKRPFLPEHVSAGAMDVMRRKRSAFDPDRLLNREVLF